MRLLLQRSQSVLVARRIFILCVFSAAACGPQEEPGENSIIAELNATQRHARAIAIRDTARARGLTNGALLGGIGDAETGLAHCWSEATWACQGPFSSSCNGPVIAGAGDGPCSLREGGLGLFQFDGGNFDQTLARDGQAILTLEGNIDHAVDFVLAMVVRSTFIDNVDTQAEALAFMNSVPIREGDPAYEAWISTVTRYYNGCSPTSSCWASRRGRYSSLTTGIYAEQGENFWGDVTPPPPPPPCDLVPAEGRIIEENDGCYSEGGAVSGWRTVAEGSGGQLKWTYTIDGAMDNFGVWSLNFAEAGNYRVEVYSDGGTYFQSRRAKYTVEHDGLSEEVILDQTSAAGFLPLGEFHFAAGPGQLVRLQDNTGEPYSGRTRIGFDALRALPIGASPPPPPPPPPPDEFDPAVAVPGADPVVAAEEVVFEPPPARIGAGELAGGCRCTAPAPNVWSFLGALLLLAGFCIIRR